MKYKNLPIGKNPPFEVNALIENPVGGQPIKYELDKDSDTMFVDRFLHTAMHYPGNYGFVPHTLSLDGDPIDIIVVGDIPVVPGAVLPAIPVGVLIMEDEQGMDEKIIAVPPEALNPYYKDVKDYTDLPQMLLDKIEHFFQHYKDLEKGKWVKTIRWGDAKEARKLINEAIDRAKNSHNNNNNPVPPTNSGPSFHP